MAFHGGVFLRNELIDIILHLVPWCSYILVDRFIEDNFDILDTVESFETESYFRLANFFDYSFMDPE